ncbi:uncharacterized protein LOC112088172 [Eutrema salsugineum]|uniref:uncharacterized protein LOC112088172 n=1 Tax=Eutrema salsugineum TaxID=72664 RepID=UPI000CED7FB4|nr:uncharacterized protein LOC112088172 [Eutrema salsugineum]
MNDPHLLVSDLINPDTKTWDIHLIRDIIDPRDIPLILSIHISHMPKEDGYCWNLSKTGAYSVRSGYTLAQSELDEETTLFCQQPLLNPLKEKIWKLKAPKKMCHFLWQMLSGAVAVNERLTIRHLDGSWKGDSLTNGVGWILQLQDGSIDLLGLQGTRRGISPLHMELLSLIWAFKCLNRHNRYCNYFVTDSKELVQMVTNPKEWLAFAMELCELEDLGGFAHDVNIVFEPRTRNQQADFLAKSARTQNRVFSYMSTSVPLWLDVENLPLADSY